MRKVKDGHCPGCHIRLAPYLTKDNSGFIKCWHCGELLNPEYGEAPPQNAAWGEEPPLAATQGHRISDTANAVPTFRSGELPPSDAPMQAAAARGQLAEAPPPRMPAPVEAMPQSQPPPSAQANMEESEERQGEFGPPGMVSVSEDSGQPPPSTQADPAGSEKRQGEFGPPNVTPHENPSDGLPQPEDEDDTAPRRIPASQNKTGAKPGRPPGRRP